MSPLRLAVLALIVAQPVGAQLTTAQIDRLDALLAPAVGKNRSVGLAVGIRCGEARWTRGYGLTKKADGHRPDASTRFEIGSISKVFTGLLLADLVGRGEVKLDTPVANLLPDDVSVPENGRPITLVDLTTHRSGLPRMPSNFRPADGLDPFADYGPEQLYAFLAECRLRRAPGERYEYSNLAVGMLGHALSRAADEPFATLLAERVLTPLGMTATQVQSTGASLSGADRFADVHNGTGRVVKSWSFDVLAGAGALRSSVDELLRFVDANLGRTDLGANKGRLQKMLTLARKVHADGGGPPIGLGWHFRDAAVHFAWHNGGTGGSTSFLALDVEHDVGVVLLCNSARSTEVTQLGWRVADAVAAIALEADKDDRR